MTTILIQGLATVMLIFFGAMAFLPLFVSDRTPGQPTTSTGEDRVLHISPVPAIERVRPAAGNQPLPFGNRVPEDDSPGRDAA